VLTAAASLRLGVVPLAERFPLPGPVEPAARAALRADGTRSSRASSRP